MNTYGAHDPMPCSVTDDGREFEPPTASHQHTEESHRCIVCDGLVPYSFNDTCSPRCENEYREGIRERARDAARENLMDAIGDVVGS